MHESNFRELRTGLLQAGIAPRHARRTVREIRDHFEDIVDARLADGCDSRTARQIASQEIGEAGPIIAAMQSCPELLCWGRRFPRLAVVVYPLTCLALLPAVPVFVGVAHAPQVARWSMSLLFAGLVTASLMLLMQLSILLT